MAYVGNGYCNVMADLVLYVIVVLTTFTIFTIAEKELKYLSTARVAKVPDHAKHVYVSYQNTRWRGIIAIKIRVGGTKTFGWSLARLACSRRSLKVGCDMTDAIFCSQTLWGAFRSLYYVLNNFESFEESRALWCPAASPMALAQSTTEFACALCGTSKKWIKLIG